MIPFFHKILYNNSCYYDYVAFKFINDDFFTLEKIIWIFLKLLF